MSNIALSVESLSKQYRLGQVGTGTLSHDLKRWWYRMRGQEDPYLKIGEANDRTIKGSSDYVWALRDISFDIQQGDAVGIIGRNGAGKSTLLKLLSKVTKPTTGNIKVRGRIASLLEVGTGFHPEMTGRENIYLNGAILGMTRKEITRKFDEIVDFAGVERYIDTPVKRYSSGMYVRLAFAVAAHLESEILIVDEVLAVGDAEFQKKCLGKMGDVSKGQGRTVLFVSHNLPSVKQLCNNCIYMKNGTLVTQGETDSVLELYKKDSALFVQSEKMNFENDYLKIKDIFHINNPVIKFYEDLNINFIIESKKENLSLAFSLFVYSDEDQLIFEAFFPFANESNSVIGDYNIEIKIPNLNLNSGEYKVGLIFAESQTTVIMKIDNFYSFEVEEDFSNSGKYLRKIQGIIRPKIEYKIL